VWFDQALLVGIHRADFELIAINADRILASVFSPTSSIRQAALWEIAAGVNCSIATIASRTRWSTASAGG
jgi:hypothetical protein